MVRNEEQIVALGGLGSCDTSFDFTFAGLFIGYVITDLIYGKRLVTVAYHKIGFRISALVIVYAELS